MYAGKTELEKIIEVETKKRNPLDWLWTCEQSYGINETVFKLNNLVFA